MTEEKPRLRTDLRVTPLRQGRRPAVVVQDPLGLQESPVALGGQALELLALLDGSRSITDIQVDLTRRHGVLVTGDQVGKALEQFDAAYLLDSDRYRAARANLVREFAARKVLEPACAGSGYPAEPEALAGYLEGVLSAGPAAGARPEGEIVAAVAPHIDFRAGPQVYAAAYSPLRGMEFDRVVILGVGHSLAGGPAALTEKDLRTPLGTVATDRELVAELGRAGAGTLAPDDFAFRGEHSVEFGALFLQHVLGKKDFRAVPVLCGSFDGLLEGRARAAEVPGLKELLAALGEAVARGPGRTLLAASVDLSHVGPKFGDGASSRAIAPEAEEHDRALLAALCARDPEAFWTEGRRAGGKFHVCGFGALACLLEVLPAGARGHLLDYHLWHEEPTRSGVSFAAAVFTAGAEAEN